MLALLDQPQVLLFLFIQECPALLEVLCSFPDVAALNSDLFGSLLDLIEKFESNNAFFADSLSAQRTLTLTFSLEYIQLGAFEAVSVLIGADDYRKLVAVVDVLEIEWVDVLKIERVEVL